MPRRQREQRRGVRLSIDEPESPFSHSRPRPRPRSRRPSGCWPCQRCYRCFCCCHRRCCSIEIERFCRVALLEGEPQQLESLILSWSDVVRSFALCLLSVYECLSGISCFSERTAPRLSEDKTQRRARRGGGGVIESANGNNNQTKSSQPNSRENADEKKVCFSRRLEESVSDSSDP